MRITYAPGVKQSLGGIAPEPRRRIKAALMELEKDPMPDGLDWKVLHDPAGRRLLRARVGHYRIVYSYHQGRVVVRRIFHRREGYRWLDKD